MDKTTKAWVALVVAVVLVMLGRVLWGTAYSQGRSDGIGEMQCIEQAQAKAMQGMTEAQQEAYIEAQNAAPGHAYPQC